MFRTIILSAVFALASCKAATGSQHVSVTVQWCDPTCERATLRVWDGDTIRRGDERIRVMGLDTPEIHDGARCPREQRLAVRARDRLVELLRSGPVRPDRRGRDRYRRTLAVVTVNGIDVAGVLIGEGLARPYRGGQRAGWC